MSQAIKAGDVCVVMEGFTRSKSPNVGKQVTVGFRVYGAEGMDHSRFGPVHTCSGVELFQLGDNGEFIKCTSADFPIAWLKKIEPPKLTKTTEEKLELEA